MIYVLKGKRFRFWPHVIVLAAYALLAVYPQTLDAAWVGSAKNRLEWWPLALCMAIMIVCVITDAFDRPVSERVAFVVLGLVIYLAITWPLFQLIGRWVASIGDAPSESTVNSTWAMMRTYAAFPQVAYSMRRSRLFETPPQKWEGEE